MPSSGMPTVSGGQLYTTYNAESISFHWGTNDTFGAPACTSHMPVFALCEIIIRRTHPRTAPIHIHMPRTHQTCTHHTSVTDLTRI